MKRFSKILSLFLSFLMVLSVISFPTINANADGSAGTLDDFVERCYTVTLDRPSDPDGFIRAGVAKAPDTCIYKGKRKIKELYSLLASKV